MHTHRCTHLPPTHTPNAQLHSNWFSANISPLHCLSVLHRVRVLVALSRQVVISHIFFKAGANFSHFSVTHAEMALSDFRSHRCDSECQERPPFWACCREAPIRSAVGDCNNAGTSVETRHTIERHRGRHLLWMQAHFTHWYTHLIVDWCNSKKYVNLKDVSLSLIWC